MTTVKINVCARCKKIYDEPKNEHCNTKGCSRDDQAVIECNPVLFWGRIADAVKGYKRDIYGVARKASKQRAIPKVKDVDMTDSKTFTGSITE